MALLDDLELNSIDDLLAMREEINTELRGRAMAELAAMDTRRQQLLLLVEDDIKINPVPDELAERRTRAPGVPKYRNPADPAQTWTGRGKRPAWLAGVEDLTEFLIAA